MNPRTRTPRRSRRTLTPALDPLESRQLLSTAAMPDHGPLLVHHYHGMRMHHPALAGRTHSGSSRGAVPATASGFHVVGQVNAFFQGTAAIADNDVWAVGYTVSNGTAQPVASHFNGASLSVSPTPTLSQGGEFYAVAAAAGNDVWAVGYQNVGSSINTLIEHWDGTSWSVVPSPKLPNGAYFQTVTAVASTDVWAAGDINVSKEGVLIEHWDGTSWSVVSSSAFTGKGPIYGISADASNDVWAVGGATSLHFNGTSWSDVAGVSTVNMGSVTALSPTNVWAAGTGPGATRNSFPRGTIVHWDGTSWSIVSSPWPNTRVSGGLGSIAAVSANNIWATGSDAGALVENWDGSSWKVVSFPTGVGIGPVTALSDGTVFVATGSGDLVEN
jgi:hypothetical protein